VNVFLPPPSAFESLLSAPIVAHGRSPQDLGEWILFSLVALGAVWVLWKAVQYSVHPGEEAPDHVKRSILADEDNAHPALHPSVAAGAPGRTPSAAPPRST
jgi:hypothetical protein